MLQNVNSRLPTFTKDQKKRVKGSFDFIGLNHYSSKFAYNTHVDLPPTGWEGDVGFNGTNIDRHGNPIGPDAESAWLHVAPWGFYKLLKWMKARYDNPLLYITENGCDAPGESKMAFPEVLHDQFRVDYYRDYLKAMDQAIFEGSRIKGYFAWSLMDNFEWADGYDYRFGLHYVNFSDPLRGRYAKDSAKWYAEYARTHTYMNSQVAKGETVHGFRRPLEWTQGSDGSSVHGILGPGNF